MWCSNVQKIYFINIYDRPGDWCMHYMGNIYCSTLLRKEQSISSLWRFSRYLPDPKEELDISSVSCIFQQEHSELSLMFPITTDVKQMQLQENFLLLWQRLHLPHKLYQNVDLHPLGIHLYQKSWAYREVWPLIKLVHN